ncbi:hypothetical protein [Anatilimnocola floriformis]|uniref:hypothetical protein n=1 Tax=Anatilimnocola floriformis TaxID=2948575 RepID=UPI0020C39C0F|nr:hypothetical protein [Anatilimnocola floriformis]
MPKTIQQDHYYVKFGQVSYPVRLMLGSIGYFGEWYCPVCNQVANAEAKNSDPDARAAVLGQVGTHHYGKHASST